jgi:DNA-binding response OmpR family regulator
VLQEVTAAGLAKTEKTIRDLGPLSINLLQKSANLHQNRLDLTETEFNLLVALTERPGKVVSNTRILSRVWGLQHDPQSNRVAVYMKKLREKLPEGMIENQRGVGYRLVIPDPN